MTIGTYGGSAAISVCSLLATGLLLFLAAPNPAVQYALARTNGCYICKNNDCFGHVFSCSLHTAKTYIALGYQADDP